MKELRKIKPGGKTNYTHEEWLEYFREQNTFYVCGNSYVTFKSNSLSLVVSMNEHLNPKTTGYQVVPG